MAAAGHDGGRQGLQRALALVLLLAALGACDAGGAIGSDAPEARVAGDIPPAAAAPLSGPSAAPPAAAPPTPAPAPDAAFVGRAGKQLMVAGKPFRFVGVNHYPLGGGPQAKSCAAAPSAALQPEEAETLLAQVAARGVNVVRLWAFQNFAGPQGTDFSALDAVVQRAKAHHLRVILTIENQWKDCTMPAVDKDAAWYGGGYARSYGYALTLPEYISALVGHFRNEPTVAMWQVMNEAQSTDGPALVAFAAATAKLIKALDPNHLVNLGSMACGGQPGTDLATYQTTYADPNIDVVEAHDYGFADTAMPACIAADLEVANALNKPFFVGEAGIEANASAALSVRAEQFAAKMQAAAAAGVAGYLLWSYNPLAAAAPGLDIGPQDPTMDVVQRMAALLH